MARLKAVPFPFVLLPGTADSSTPPKDSRSEPSVSLGMTGGKMWGKCALKRCPMQGQIPHPVAKKATRVGHPPELIWCTRTSRTECPIYASKADSLTSLGMTGGKMWGKCSTKVLSRAKSNSPPCRKERDKGGAPSRVDMVHTDCGKKLSRPLWS